MELPVFLSLEIFYDGTVAIFLAVLCITLWWYSSVQTRRRWSGKTRPPGPRGLPVLGNLLSFINTDPRAQFTKYAEQYGDIFRIRLGAEEIVVLNSADVIREAFIKRGNSFTDRPNTFFVEHLAKGKGIASSSGPRWREQRRYTHKVLKEFGMGRSLLEDRVLEEVSFYLKELGKQNGCPQDIRQLTGTAVSNVISYIIFGHRFDYNDKTFLMFIDKISELVELVGNRAIFNFFPFLRHLPGDLFSVNKVVRIKQFLDILIQSEIDHQNAGITSLTDVYLRKIKTMSQADITPDHFFNEDQLLQLMFDLMTAGTETTATTLRWAVLYMLHHPGIQEKLHTEIDDVIGTDKTPTMTDMVKMPYTEAFIKEAQRMGDIIPFSIPHSTTEDVELRGYTIPAGTSVWTNLNRVHFDIAVWGDPHNFRPERFLVEKGKSFLTENLMPFSVGGRACLGESLARMELFLFITSMLQKFTFKAPKGVSLPGLMDGVLGITHSPKPYTVCVTSR